MKNIKDICVLPTNNIVITDFECSLHLFNSQFICLKTVSGFDKFRFIPNGLATSYNQIFISDSHYNRIIITDFDVNVQKTFNLLGCGNDQISKPQGLFWHPKSGNLYVCDNRNKKLKIFDGNFNLVNCVLFEFKSDKIQISPTTAFISDSTFIDLNLHIFRLHDWKLLHKYEYTNSLYQISSHFYSIQFNSFLLCFNSNGNFINKIDISEIINEVYKKYEVKGMFMLNKSLIFYSHDKRCIKFNMKH